MKILILLIMISFLNFYDKCESKYLSYFNRRFLKIIIIINEVGNIFENELKEYII